VGLPLSLHVPDLCGAQNQKLAHFGKLTKKDEPNLSGLLALARATLPMIKLCSGEVMLSWTRSKYLSCFCPCLWWCMLVVQLLEEALTKSPNLDYVTNDRLPDITVA